MTKTAYLRKPKNSCSLVQIKCTSHWHDNKLVYVVGTEKQNNKNKCLRTQEYVLISNAVHFHAETGMITNNICSWCRQTLDKSQSSDCLTSHYQALAAKYKVLDVWFLVPAYSLSYRQSNGHGKKFISWHNYLPHPRLYLLHLSPHQRWILNHQAQLKNGILWCSSWVQPSSMTASLARTPQQ